MPPNTPNISPIKNINIVLKLTEKLETTILEIIYMLNIYMLATAIPVIKPLFPCLLVEKNDPTNILIPAIIIITVSI